MQIISIEPTPSPYSMKINVNEQLQDGETFNYTLQDDLQDAPAYIQQLFQINGVKGIYRVVDFIALERNPRVAWEDILPKVSEVLGSAEENNAISPTSFLNTDEAFGEVQVYLQLFRYIPMQVKVTDGNTEKRFGLPERFMDAVMEASTASDNMLEERKWIEQNPRYGEIETVGEEVVEEITASYDEKRLHNLIQYAKTNDASFISSYHKKVTMEMLDHPNWKERYAALDRMEPSKADLPVLNKALADEKASVRRLATAYLGMIENKEVLPYLYKALKDKAVNVRRTAGDCLSDLGFSEAIPAMIEALKDKSRLVRWRAAMFLYERGDETAIEALEDAVNDPEFEVRMQAKMALARIKDGEEAKGSIWSQMTKAVKEKNLGRG
ncbi:conserved virulence factor C family protein [Virgibacillus chiguensis]|uniref:HEAT repeat-containing protein n=1 Tax=Virgibacillus chiguensis TaxID=411959 RepID=A0A1M5URZ9_9BACI|nr:conserved virulence factor C family protein [Virgibacillus chiguensis]SHH65696.1 HEAT repeat-containing protein [Virgibacillus chiguensis]